MTFLLGGLRSRGRGAWRLASVVVLGLTLGLAVAVPAATAADDGDPPGRVGRLSDLRGSVSWYDAEAGQWATAERNRPLTGGDRLATGAESRVELRVGSTVLRLGAGTEFEVLQLDDDRMRFQLHGGSLALRVRSRDLAEEIEVITDEARLRPTRAGHYRIDRLDDTSYAGALRGSLRIDDPHGFVVETGERVELWREGRSDELRHAWGSLPDDGFGDWVARADQAEERTAATRHVSPEMTGAEDLDRHGRWERHPEYGVLWFPIEVAVGWAPYRHGRWAWVRPWGWTWVDAAPWGFAPFHYGRWVHWQGRWAWWPGERVLRPVFAPALVAWVGGAHWSLSVNLGGPPVGWVPLAPREVYVPWYRATPVYVERVNRRPPGRQWVPARPHGPVTYANQGAPGGMTVVPRDVLLQRRPVPGHAVDPRDIGPAAPGRPGWVGVLPPERPAPRTDGAASAPRPPAWPGRVGSGPRDERPLRTERGERRDGWIPADRGGRVDGPQRPDRVERTERTERPERPGRAERGEFERPAVGPARPSQDNGRNRPPGDIGPPPVSRVLPEDGPRRPPQRVPVPVAPAPAPAQVPAVVVPSVVVPSVVVPSVVVPPAGPAATGPQRPAQRPPLPSQGAQTPPQRATSPDDGPRPRWRPEPATESRADSRPQRQRSPDQQSR